MCVFLFCVGFLWGMLDIFIYKYINVYIVYYWYVIDYIIKDCFRVFRKSEELLLLVSDIGFFVLRDFVFIVFKFEG